MKLDKFIRIVLGLLIVVVFLVAIGALLFFTEAALNVWDRLLEGPRLLRWGYVGAMLGLVALAVYLIWLLLIRASSTCAFSARSVPARVP
jgi:NADH:ubiquinone oxidoreductase subunit 6 (subunit J)